MPGGDQDGDMGGDKDGKTGTGGPSNAPGAPVYVGMARSNNKEVSCAVVRSNDKK